MQLIVISCVSFGLILALCNALKPFSAWPHTGEYPTPLQECVLYKMSQERASNALSRVGFFLAVKVVLCYKWVKYILIPSYSHNCRQLFTCHIGLSKITMP